ncbi:hypothetical protein FBULB1_13342 [Fusarium bulbicola]|nr:hypothetical protein FBULB1_13342 [Fusarium bulbicola]
MSTSTGESGWCLYCGHPLNEHTKERHSRCQKCNKRLLICQVQHGTGGYSICDVPCGCGKKHYPSAAKEAHELEESEYASTHPQYKPPESPEPDYVRVKPKMDGGQLKFTHKNKQISSYHDNWDYGLMMVDGKKDTWWMLDMGSIVYYAWDLPSTETVPSKTVAQPSHERTDSGSTDPLSWDQERLEANTQMTSMMGSLNLQGGGSSQAEDNMVRVTARYYKTDKVEFMYNGEMVKSMATSWVRVHDGGGYKFESNKYGRTFFATEIKPLAKRK